MFKFPTSHAKPDLAALHDDTWQVLGERTLRSEPDLEHLSVDKVLGMLQGLDLPVTCLERLEISVTEAIRSAMQHENQVGQQAPVVVCVLISSAATRQIERQSPGACGFFLIERLEQAPSDSACRVIALFVYREGGTDDRQND